MTQGLTRRITVVAILVVALVGVASAPAAAGPCLPRVLSVSDATQIEGSPGDTAALRFTVTSTGCTEGKIQFVTVGAVAGGAPAATPGVDFLPVAGGLAWGAGESGSRTVTVAIVGDSAIEPDETLALRLSNPVGLTTLDPVGLGRIVNDDVSITLIGKPFCDETCVLCWLRVVTSAPVVDDLTLLVDTAPDTAAAGPDYVALRGVTLTVAAGATTADVAVAIVDDRAAEGFESFVVHISEPSAGVVTAGSAAVHIVDDD